MLIMMAMRGGDVDDIDVWVRDEGGVGAVCFGGRRGVELVEEVLGAGGGGGGCGCDDLVADVVDGAGGGVDEEVFCEGCGDVAGCWGIY